MSKAIVPTEMPSLPDGMTGWIRSTKGHGGMYHAHTIGWSACGRIQIDRHHKEDARHLGDMTYWGVCPRCLAKAK